MSLSKFIELSGFRGTPGEILAQLNAKTVRVSISEKVTWAGLAGAERLAIADALLSGSVASIEASSPEHSLCTVVLACLQSKPLGTQWKIKRTDGVTVHTTKVLSLDPNAHHVIGVS